MRHGEWLARADIRQVRRQAAPCDRETGRAPLNDFNRAERFVFYPLDMTIREGSRPEAGQKGRAPCLVPSPLFIAAPHDARPDHPS